MRKTAWLSAALLLSLLLTACANREAAGSATLPAPNVSAVMAQIQADSSPAASEPAASEPEQADALDYADMTADDLLAHFQDPLNPTLEEYMWLLDTYRYVGITDELELEDSITEEAFSKLWEQDANFPDTEQAIPQLIVSDAPQVRGEAVRLMGGLTGLSAGEISLAKQLIASEKEPYVINRAVIALANEGCTDPAIGRFLLDMAKNDRAVIRQNAAYALGNSWSENLDGALVAVITLMGDSDGAVRTAACANVGYLHDAAAVAPLSAILKDPAQSDLHGDCAASLITLWYDYPFHEHTSEAAYRATLDYWKTTPRTEQIPSWLSLTGLAYKADDSFGAWKARAAYYSAEEIDAVMRDILLDPNADYLARVEAIDVILAQGGPDALRALGSDVAAMTDEGARQVQQTYADDLANLG